MLFERVRTVSRLAWRAVLVAAETDHLMAKLPATKFGEHGAEPVGALADEGSGTARVSSALSSGVMNWHWAQWSASSRLTAIGASVGRATAPEVARLILNANEPISPGDRFC